MGVGRHLLADLYGARPESLDDAPLLGRCLALAARRCGMTALGEPVLHRFPGGGVTGFILLAESHIAFHTFPEKQFMALDVFSCGSGEPREAVEVFREAIGATSERVTATVRGDASPS